MRNLDNFFDIRKLKLDVFNTSFRKRTAVQSKVNIPEGLFQKCDACTEMIYIEDLIAHEHVCPHCSHHFKMPARVRLFHLVDRGQFEEINFSLSSANPLAFPGYEQKILSYQASSNETDAFISGIGVVGGIKVAIGALDPSFMMGSMGSVVGEKVTRLIEKATAMRLPLIIFSASGGARMQEGIFSLMQMAKTSAALNRHANQNLLYISVLTHPTTGGVAASFATLGDINIAEKGALIGFAGQRVIKNTINQDLPKGFQTAEFQRDKGFVDVVVERKSMKPLLEKLLKLHAKGDAYGKA